MTTDDHLIERLDHIYALLQLVAQQYKNLEAERDNMRALLDAKGSLAKEFLRLSAENDKLRKMMRSIVMTASEAAYAER